jgi:hypothetical protein
MPKPKKVKKKVFRKKPRRRFTPGKRATIALTLFLSFLIGCKAKPVKKPFKPGRPVPVKPVELPKLKNFDAFLKAFQERLKRESPEKIALEYPKSQQKKVLEALTFLAKAKMPSSMKDKTKEINQVHAKVKRFINEQTRLDRSTMGLLAEQWVRDHALKSTPELLRDRLELQAQTKVPDEFAYDARAVALEIIFQILKHRLNQAK